MSQSFISRLRALPLIILTILLLASGAQAQLNPPAAPDDAGSAMYNLSDLYNRLESGAAGAKRSGGFSEPSAEPADTMHSLDDIMGKMPTVDDDSGATAAQVLEGKTFWGLRSEGGWGLLTGTMPSPIMGPDADPYRYLVAASDGSIIRDTITGLEWKRCAQGMTWDANSNVCAGTAGTWTWGAAMESFENADAYGFRLPTIDELRTLVYCSSGTPVLIDMTSDSTSCSGSYISPTIFSPAFPNTPATFFWSASELAGNPDRAWFVRFLDGLVSHFNKFSSPAVRLVRGGQ